MPGSVVITPSGNRTTLYSEENNYKSEIKLERGSAIITSGFSLSSNSGKMQAIVMNKHLSKALFEKDSRPNQCLVIRFKNGVPYATPALAKPSGNHGIILEEPSLDNEAEINQSTLDFLPTVKKTLEVLHREVDSEENKVLKENFDDYRNLIENCHISGHFIEDPSPSNNESLEIETSNNGSLEIETSKNESLEIETLNNESSEIETSKNESLEIETSKNESLEIETSKNESLEIETSNNESCEIETSNNESIEIENIEDAPSSTALELSTDGHFIEDPLPSNNESIEIENKEDFPTSTTFESSTDEKDYSEEMNDWSENKSNLLNDTPTPPQTVQDIIDRLTKEIALESLDTCPDENASVENQPKRVNSTKTVVESPDDQISKRVVRRSTEQQRSAKREVNSNLSTFESRNANVENQKYQNKVSWSRRKVLERRVTRTSLRNSQDQNGSMIHNNIESIDQLTSENKELAPLTVDEKKMLPPRNLRYANKSNKKNQSFSQSSELPKRNNPRRRITRSQRIRNYTIRSSNRRKINAKENFNTTTGRKSSLVEGRNVLSDPKVNKSTKNKNKVYRRRKRKDNIHLVSSNKSQKENPGLEELRCCNDEELDIELKHEVPDPDLEHGSLITPDNLSNPTPDRLECEAFIVEVKREEPGSDCEHGSLLTIKNILGPAPENLNEVDGEIDFYIKKEEDYYFYGDSQREDLKEALSWGYIKEEFTENHEEDIPFEGFLDFPDEAGNNSSNFVIPSLPPSVSSRIMNVTTECDELAVSEKFKCYYCGYQTRRKRVLERHIRRLHIKMKHCFSTEVFKIKSISTHYPNWKHKRRCFGVGNGESTLSRHQD